MKPQQIMKPTEATTFDKNAGITFKPGTDPNAAPAKAYKIQWGSTVKETLELNKKNGIPLELVKDPETQEFFFGVKHSWDDGYYRVDRESVLVKYGEGDWAPVAEADGARIFSQTYVDADGKAIDIKTMQQGTEIYKNPNSTVGAVAFDKPRTVTSLEGDLTDVEMVRTDVDGHPYGTYEQLAKDIRKGKLVANESDPNSAKFIELVKAGKDEEAQALLRQVSIEQSQNASTVNPHHKPHFPK